MVVNSFFHCIINNHVNYNRKNKESQSKLYTIFCFFANNKLKLTTFNNNQFYSKRM
ncbi:hypothetical protein HanXRQr2_Chr12g0562951 [Helianthus annuus]|uniref:Uncharacterized protein n=1 Tax=Helianthus annuus TaxID=4232 RepID=A0A9K3HJY0_HELAN|nr:hypothetical protein HanXRQr2_Chr12g0562951 [Helianthus annuus]KAJ0864476.1 hypothetical protein HanPSC8_Chr12g0542391 [Helianthus annuus]